MLSGRGDIKLQLMLSEHFEILRRVTSIVYTSLPSVFVIGSHVCSEQDYQDTR